MKISLSEKPKSQAQQKTLHYFHNGNAPYWKIDTPSHSDPNIFWTLTYCKDTGKLECNCPSSTYNCKHVQMFKVRLGEAFLSMCFDEEYELPLVHLANIIHKAFHDHHLILEDPVPL
jgi:hypothetical protein